MASLGSHANVWETCLQILHQRGWTLRRELSPCDDGADGWIAVKGEFDLVADNPIELLGLSAIYDELQPTKHRSYWWTISPAEGAPELVDSLLEEALKARDARVEALRELRATAPEAWSAKISNTLENSGSDDDAAAQLGIPTAEWLQIQSSLVATKR